MSYKASTVLRGAKAAARTRRHRPVRHPASANLATYSPDQFDFLRAVDNFRRQYGRPFLCATDYLTLAESLGWVRKTTQARA